MKKTYTDNKNILTDAAINAMVARNPDNITAPVLVAAVAELKRRQDAENTERAIAQLGSVARNTESAVNNLRNARRVEAKAKKLLVAYAAAEKDFQANGDYTAYTKAIIAADNNNRGY